MTSMSKYRTALRRLNTTAYIAGASTVLLLLILTAVPVRSGVGPEPAAGEIPAALTAHVGGVDIWQRSLQVSAATRPGCNPPRVVILAPAADWHAALAATSLIAPPLDGCLLLVPPNQVPDELREEMERLAPRGLPWDGGNQVLLVGDMPRGLTAELDATSFRHRHLNAGSPAELAATVDIYLNSLRGKPGSQLAVVPEDDPAAAVVAADWAAHKGSSILFAARDRVPAATIGALAKRRQQAHMKLVFRRDAMTPGLLDELAAFGVLDASSAGEPVELAVDAARYRAADQMGEPTGWGANTPGQGFTFALLGQPFDSVLAANFTHRGAHGPLLPITPDRVPGAVIDYLEDIRPDTGAVQGSSLNTGWIVGAESAVGVRLQRRVECLLQPEGVTD